jgi:hypothetical protein
VTVHGVLGRPHEVLVFVWSIPATRASIMC